MTTTIEEQNKGKPFDAELKHLVKEELKHLINVNDISKKYNYTTAHIYRLINEGKIETQIIGGFTLIDKRTLPDWFKPKVEKTKNV